MSNPALLSSSKIIQISMTAHDVDRATTFYRDKLGLKPLFRFGNLSFFDAGGQRILLTKPEKPEFDHPGSILYFDVPDIHVTHGELVAQGIEFMEKPAIVAAMPNGNLWLAAFHDSEGNTLALMSLVPHA